MISRNHSSGGFAVFEGLLVIVMVAIIGAVGYMGYNNFIAPQSARQPNIVAATVSPDVSPAPVSINTTADLDTVSNSLDAISLGDNDNAQFDSATSNF